LSRLNDLCLHRTVHSPAEIASGLCNIDSSDKTVRESREHANFTMEEDLDYDDGDILEENPILEGDEEAKKVFEERVLREL
jgi:hypothetical protein